MRSVLVIDDNEDLLETLAEALPAEGFHVQVAHDGADAFAKLAREPLPDAILLDLGMPHMTGWQFRELQRRHPALAHIPVVVMSASTPVGIDAAAVIEKPCPIATVAGALRRVIPLERVARRSDTGTWSIVRPDVAADHELQQLLPEPKSA